MFVQVFLGPGDIWPINNISIFLGYIAIHYMQLDILKSPLKRPINVQFKMCDNSSSPCNICPHYLLFIH